MPLQSQQIVSMALQIAKCPGFTSQGGQFLNSLLQDLCENYDLDLALGTFTFTFNSALGQGAGPYNLPTDYLRTQVKDGKDEFFYTIQGVPYPLIQITKAEYDWLVQTPGFQSFPYNYATDLSQSPAQLFVWPPANGAYPCVLRYYRQMPDIVTPETSSTVPWFNNTQVLIRGTAGLLMQLTGDDRIAEFLGDDEEKYPLGVGTILKKYLKNVEDREGAVHTVGKDRRRWGRPFDQLKNTKNIGWSLIAVAVLGAWMYFGAAMPARANCTAPCTKPQITTDINTNWPDNTSGLITPALLRSTVSDLLFSYLDIVNAAANSVKCNPTGSTANVQDCVAINLSQTGDTTTFSAPPPGFGGTWLTVYDFTTTYTATHSDARSTLSATRTATGSGTNGPANADYGAFISASKASYLSSAVEGEVDGIYVNTAQGNKGDTAAFVGSASKVRGGTGPTGGAIGTELGGIWTDTSGNALMTVQSLSAFAEGAGGQSSNTGYGYFTESRGPAVAAAASIVQPYAAFYGGAFDQNGNCTAHCPIFSNLLVGAGSRTASHVFFSVAQGISETGDITVGSGAATGLDGNATQSGGTRWTMKNASGAWQLIANDGSTSLASINQSGSLQTKAGYLSGGSILSPTATGGIGYATGFGAGGAVTQLTSRTTGVTLNNITGAITLFAAAPVVGTPVSFTVTDSAVAATDVPTVAVKSATDVYEALVTAVAAGSFQVTVTSLSGTTSDSPVINFAVIKGSAN